MKTLPPHLRRSLGQPAWDVAHLYPLQGTWSESDYLALNGNHLIEFTDGIIEVLPMPTTLHQRIVAFLYASLNAFVTTRGLGEVLFSPLPVRLRSGKYREPDIVFMLAEHADRIRDEYWDGADLAIEVVSGDKESRSRDLKAKRDEYERARIPEYWIVDPFDHVITVLRLKGRRYVTVSKAGRDDRAASALLKGFEVGVDEVFRVKSK